MPGASSLDTITCEDEGLQLIAPSPLQPRKPLFVFLPGMDGSGQLLRTQLSGLSQGFDVRCLALSTTNNWPWTKLVQRSLALLRTAIFEQPRSAVYLCGESFGGCLAIQLATEAPQLFNRLVLVNPASSFQRLPWMQWGAALSQWLPEPLYRLSNLGLIPFLIQQQRVSATAREALWQSIVSVPAMTALWRVTLLSQFRARELPLEKLSLPTLLIAGEADALLPSVEEVCRLAKRLPQAQVVTLPNSGHACLLEKDVNLYALMAEAQFLQSPPAGSSSRTVSVERRDRKTSRHPLIDDSASDSLYSNEGAQNSDPFATLGQ